LSLPMAEPMREHLWQMLERASLLPPSVEQGA
jgi:hypothetical protein